MSTNKTTTHGEPYRNTAEIVLNEFLGKAEGEEIADILKGGLEGIADIIIKSIEESEPKSDIIPDKNRILHILGTYNIPFVNNKTDRMSLIRALNFLAIENIEERYNAAISDINFQLERLGKVPLPSKRSELLNHQKKHINLAHETHNINPFLLSEEQLQDKKDILEMGGFNDAEQLLLLQSFVCGIDGILKTVVGLALIFFILKECGVTTGTSTVFDINDTTYPDKIVVSDGEDIQSDTIRTSIAGFAAYEDVASAEVNYTMGYDLDEGSYDMNIEKTGAKLVISNVSFPDTIRRAFNIDGPHSRNINRSYFPDIIEDQIKNGLAQAAHQDSVRTKMEVILNTSESKLYELLIANLSNDPNYYRDAARAIARAIGGSHSDIAEVEIHFQTGVSFFLERQGNGTYKITKNKGLGDHKEFKD